MERLPAAPAARARVRTATAAPGCSIAARSRRRTPESFKGVEVSMAATGFSTGELTIPSRKVLRSRSATPGWSSEAPAAFGTAAAGVGNVFGGNIQALTNAAGAQIQGGDGGPSGAGGAGVYNDLDSYTNTFKNSGTVAGGAGLSSGVGGAGVANFGTTAHVGRSGTITALTNNATGTIAG